MEKLLHASYNFMKIPHIGVKLDLQNWIGVTQANFRMLLDSQLERRMPSNTFFIV
jgi:hypothetical protein